MASHWPVTDLDVAVHGGGLGSSDQPLQFSTTVVLGLSRQLWDVDVSGQQAEAFHLVGVDGQDLDTSLLIRQAWAGEARRVGLGRLGGVRVRGGKRYQGLILS